MNNIHRLGDPPPRTVAVFRALNLGDLLCTVPALRALRKALPEARVTLIGLPWARAFVERFSQHLDDLMEFPGFPGIPERTLPVQHVPGFLMSANQRHFDLALQMHGNGIVSNPFTVLLGARLNAGLFLPGQYCPDKGRFLPFPEQESEMRRYLKLMEFLGVPLQGDDLEFPLFEADYRALDSIDEAYYLKPGEYICVHAGARAPARRWLPERFAAVADVLARQGLKVVLTGTSAEAELAETVAGDMKTHPLNLVGQTNLGALAVLLSRAHLLICNDTGVSHIAAALRVPSVVIFTGSDPNRWAPLDGQLHRVVYQAAECSPCDHMNCPIDHRCATSITIGDVLAETEYLLQG